ncbi:hypothetical protein FHW96_003725 [Novosphingobium sp. SG751A]|uniref:hypothetical protein n=1 Tax=Novosphingobium sp. SG751A TaxID=2587000 RepID=UPI00155553CC|nr:hypothetical protein [Novosphingobium sp. SG751A]NOW47545.1 hypothetical protein [Novosphingobium sp. SG751A]
MAAGFIPTHRPAVASVMRSGHLAVTEAQWAPAADNAASMKRMASSPANSWSVLTISDLRKPVPKAKVWANPLLVALIGLVLAINTNPPDLQQELHAAPQSCGKMHCCTCEILVDL